MAISREDFEAIMKRVKKCATSDDGIEVASIENILDPMIEKNPGNKLTVERVKGMIERYINDPKIGLCEMSVLEGLLQEISEVENDIGST